MLVGRNFLKVLSNIPIKKINEISYKIYYPLVHVYFFLQKMLNLLEQEWGEKFAFLIHATCGQHGLLLLSALYRAGEEYRDFSVAVYAIMVNPTFKYSVESPFFLEISQR